MSYIVFGYCFEEDIRLPLCCALAYLRFFWILVPLKKISFYGESVSLIHMAFSHLLVLGKAFIHKHQYRGSYKFGFFREFQSMLFSYVLCCTWQVTLKRKKCFGLEHKRDQPMCLIIFLVIPSSSNFVFTTSQHYQRDVISHSDVCVVIVLYSSIWGQNIWSLILLTLYLKFSVYINFYVFIQFFVQTCFFNTYHYKLKKKKKNFNITYIYSFHALLNNHKNLGTIPSCA